MRGYVINHYAHPKDLTLSLDAPEPTPGPGEVLVDVYSAALNFFDVNNSRCVQSGSR
jgi:NADPH2:quinone reductase